ncbi:MAG TPA: hypothetical protein DIW47_07110 [Bacteroidetes bacterium]|nr:hypothetical protein [Bacteroidota bacterium]
MEYFPTILFVFAVLISITRPLTVLFHELGHAIPAILMTRKAVSIYIGSYGDPKGSVHFRVGLLDVWFKYNPFLWRLGLCVPSARPISINKQIIYTLTGPLTSFVIAAVSCYITFAFDLHGSVKLVLVVFLFSSVFDLIVNLTPRETPFQLYDGRLTYNDGYQLKQLFSYKRFSKEYKFVVGLYDQEKFTEAAVSLDAIIKRGVKDGNIYRLAISSHQQVKNYNQAKVITDAFIIYGKLKSEDYTNAGLSYSRLGQHDRAMELYDKSLELNPHNTYSLNNKGFTLIELNKFEEAIPIFDQAIKSDKTFSYAYANRGLAKIKIGKTKEGLDDINYSIKLDENNSYAYRNLGIYHLDKGENSTALDLFKKAKELDGTTHLIDELIDEADSYE